jgi:hypothetical protein
MYERNEILSTSYKLDDLFFDIYGVNRMKAIQVYQLEIRLAVVLFRYSSSILELREDPDSPHAGIFGGRRSAKNSRRSGRCHLLIWSDVI